MFSAFSGGRGGGLFLKGEVCPRISTCLWHWWGGGGGGRVKAHTTVNKGIYSSGMTERERVVL